MARLFILLAALAAALAPAAPAAASPVLVVGADGAARWSDDPALPGADAANGIDPDPVDCGAGAVAAAARAGTASRRAGVAGAPPVARAAVLSVGRALRRAYDRGGIDRGTYSGYKEVYSDAKSAWHRLSGSRQDELGAVITTVNALAARRQLTPSRMRPVFLELQRNTEWWTRSASPSPSPSPPTTGKPPKKTACTTAGRIAAGSRVQFKGDPLTLQYYPGSGLRLQPLANFGKANALYNACRGIDTEEGTPCRADQLRRLLDRLVATAARRRGFLAWEYYFWFGGGRPPWVSGIATGSALSALARGAALFRELEAQPPPEPQPEQPADPQTAPTDPLPSGGTTPPPPPPATAAQDQEQPHGPDWYLGKARAALPVYKTSYPVGIRARAARGNHYLIYSFNPGLRVGNAFLESLIGLWDYAEVSGDRSARALFEAGDREARHELPLLDTGAWSLYSLGGAESDLNYHRVIRDFAEGLCERTKISSYCQKAARFDKYLYTPPVVSIVDPGATRVGRATKIAVRVDKISCITVQVLRGDEVVTEPTWYFPRGVHSITWTPPKKGTYRVHVLARDLMHRTARADAELRVLPRKRRR